MRPASAGDGKPPVLDGSRCCMLVLAYDTSEPDLRSQGRAALYAPQCGIQAMLENVP